jgi:hypothetical protein
MILAVVGSRDFVDIGKVDNYLNQNPPDKIITGGARGVDTAAENWAKKNNIPYEVIRPKDPNVKQDYILRNIDIINKAEAVVVFYDGSSPGSTFVIKHCKMKNKPLTIIEGQK